MIQISHERLDHLFGRFATKRIAVLGDLMLDHYVWGKVKRISPEAPVPVVEVESESYRFGGAANVAYNVLTLGAQVIPFGIVGHDEAGERLKTLFREHGIPSDGILTVSGRPTTMKSRIIAHHQHVVRTDREVTAPIDPETETHLLELMTDFIPQIDGIIFEDYDKGCLTPSLIRRVIREARGRPTFVDPKFQHFFDYERVSLFKPNRKETEDRLGFSLMTWEARERAGEELLKRLQCQAVMITLGEEGLMLFEPGKKGIHVPTRAVKVHDVSGAGDTVIASMAVAMTAGASLYEAATLANHAAGIVIGEVGIVPIERDRLYRAMIDASR